MGGSPYRGRVDRCVNCGSELGVGRYCLNCGHRIGEPATRTPAPVEPGRVARAQPEPIEPVSLPVQAADPTPVPPVTPVARKTRARPESDWDPRVELLPYEEVDDVRRDDPLRGRAWIAWVLGAVLLVGLVFVLLETFGTVGDGADDSATDPDTSATTTSAPGAEGTATDAPTGVGKRLNLASAATIAVPATGEPTTDFDGTLVAYEASQMADRNTSTTWRMEGDATGESVTLTLAEPAVVERVGIVNGYAKQVAGVDWYPNNRRILSVTWSFEDGTSVEQTFAERPGMQRLKVPPVQTGTVTLTITSVTPPGLGNLGRDYTAISEVEVIGRRAG